MRRLLFLLLILIGSLAFREILPEPITTQPTPTSAESITAETLYTVTKVIDGDTVEVDMNGQTERLRLIGIDTPEVDARLNPVECYGAEASTETKTKLLGQKVRIEQDPTQAERDKYNRLLVYIFLIDNTNFNEYLLEEGFAKEYTYAKAYKYQATFKEAEDNAKSAQKGLWSPTLCPIKAS